MRNIFLLGLVLLLGGCGNLQPIPEEDKTFEKVVVVKGISKDAIYESTKMWIAENFRSAKAVLEYEDKEIGKIVGNGSIKYPCSGLECVTKNEWSVLFTMKVDVKDEKFRLTFTNLRLAWPPTYNSLGAQPGHEGPIHTQGDLNTIKPVLLNMGDEIAAFISNSKSKNDW